MSFARVLARPPALCVMVLVLLNMLAVAHFFIRLENGVPTFDMYRIDLDVYRLGARAWLAGDDLYGPLPPTSLGLSLPFTYPPVSAVVFTPLTLVSLPVASAVLGLLTLLGLIVTIGIVLRSLAPEWPGRWLLAGAVLAVAAVLEPVRRTVFYGQVNVVLMALVVLDCLAGRRWPRGVLVGLAAAVKLTPAAFVLFFLVRRDYSAALRAASAFLAVTAVGLLLAWDDSVRFWSDTLWDTGRIGNPHYAGNQSLPGVLARLGLEPPGRTAVWVLGAAAVVATAAIGMRRALAAGVPALALALNALAVLVVSPVSWSHHWVWVIPVLLSMGIVWWTTRVAPMLFILAVGVVLFLISPHWWFPETENVEYEWDVGQQLLGNAYIWFALSALVVATVCDRPLCCPIGHPHRSARRIRSVGSPPASRPRGNAMVSTSDFPAGSAGVPVLRYAFPTGPVATASVDIGHTGVRFELFLHGELEVTTDPRADRECVLNALRVMAKRLMVSGIGSDAPTIASAGLAFRQHAHRLRAPHTMEFSGACTVDVSRQYDCGLVGLSGAVGYRLDLSATPGAHAVETPAPTQATAWFQRYEQELASIGVVVLVAVPIVPGRLA